MSKPTKKPKVVAVKKENAPAPSPGVSTGTGYNYYDQGIGRKKKV
jgi:hypothetical protein